MAGDWIKMRSDLFTHPKVVRIASALKADSLRTVGGLMSAWCLFDAHSVDGHLDGYTLEVLDDHLRWPGFAQAMVSVGWLEESPSGGLSLPRFDAHNGQSAKRRAQDADRKREVRKPSASEADKKRTREEKRREEIKEVVLPSEQGAPGTEGFTPTPSGQVGQALKRAGISMTSVSLPDPRINALLEQGATPEEFEAVAREAVERQIAKPIGWICSTLAGRRSDAAKLTLAPAQPTTADRMAWRKTTDGVLAMGQELGVQNREADTWEDYERRVLSAFQRREAAKETS